MELHARQSRYGVPCPAVPGFGIGGVLCSYILGFGVQGFKLRIGLRVLASAFRVLLAGPYNWCFRGLVPVYGDPNVEGPDLPVPCLPPRDRDRDRERES